MSEIDKLRAVYEPLAQSVRRLIDISIRSRADVATVKSAIDKIDGAADELANASLLDGAFGLEHSSDGQVMAWGNVVMGVRNPIAVPLVVHHEDDGSVWAEFVLGAAFEGPAGHVHGGVCAMLLDHVLGATAHKPGMPAVTGTLTLRYRRGTQLGRELRAEAHVDRVEGVKTFAVGHIADDQGVTVEAEGIFIHPKKADHTAG
ncbi:PaaI family thioesterase [Mycolicibacterium sp. GF69]|uniref:PaaI family thioesterase n=1 Tax=Mycolicibacterium sp. GF69 TaxID=2267251 RepID=UPI000DCEC0EA|nr:PaaI family thioesterase [Mycolicibacterium sp. GF69]RAV07583.1 PaaI family thioesterase [Mycolicibacterium sp. GF69]